MMSLYRSLRRYVIWRGGGGLGLGLLGFWGFRGLGFGGLEFRGLGFRVQEFLGFWGFRV